MSITRFAIEKNRITTVALLIVIFGGLSAFFSLPRAEDPGFIIRTAVVRTYFPGASPERVADLVTDPIEEVVQEIPELDFVASESRTGFSLVFVNIDERYTHMRPIWDSLRRKIDRVRTQLPEGVYGPFVDDEFGDVFGIVITITGDGYTPAELADIGEEVKDEILRLDEVAKVEIYGAQEERIYVDYDNARLSELGISPGQLQQILEGVNIVLPGGDIVIGEEGHPERIALEPTGSFESLEELRQTIINVPGEDDVIFLGDIAEVYRGLIEPPESFVHSSDLQFDEGDTTLVAPLESSIAVAVSMREGGNIITLGEQIVPLVDRLQTMYPHGIEFDITAFQPQVVDTKVKEFVGSLLQAVGIVMLVMLLFLGLRTGLVVASLIPSAMLFALLVMSFLGIGLDQMSLASLIIALGMLVDNAIVMAESIMVQIRSGMKPVEAAVASAKELRLPLLTSSLTTAAAFLPIFLAESATGEYTAPLFKVVTITLLCSWTLAITMTPLLCVLFLKVKQRRGDDPFGSLLYRAYRRFLGAILRWRLVSVLVIAGIFWLALMGFRFVPVLFFPPSDKAIFTVELEMAPGTPVEETRRIVSDLEAFLTPYLLETDATIYGDDSPDEEGIINWAAFIGDGGPRFYLSYDQQMSRPEYAILVANATSQEPFDELFAAIEAFMRNYPDVEVTVRPLNIGPPVTTPVAVRISGTTIPGVFRIADQLAGHLAEIPGTRAISDDWGPRTKRLRVNVNQAAAQQAGVSNRDIALSLQTVLSGIESTQYREADEAIPVVMRSLAADREDFSKLETLSVFRLATGNSVPLLQVATLQPAWSPSKILRRGGLPTVTVSADVLPGVTATDINRQIVPWLEEQAESWPIGYRFELGGEAETSGTANQSIAEKLPIALMIIVLLLVAQFNSFRRPLIILLTIPLGIIGVVIGLIVAKSYFGFMTLLGIISLSGIVINNAIVLIDRIKIEIEENGHDPPRAVIEAAQRRLRPILLTTCTTIGGLLPLWLGGGPMWEPMAIAIIFGLLFATLLTLGVVPVLYSLFFRVRYKGFRYPG